MESMYNCGGSGKGGCKNMANNDSGIVINAFAKGVKEQKKGKKKFNNDTDTEITVKDEPPKIKICEICPEDIFNLVVCAVKALSTEHKVSMEDILEVIKKEYELPMSDCEFYVQMEQQLIRAVACGAVCVRMNKFYAAGMKPPSNFDLKNPHCHEKPFPPPECPSEDEEEEEDEESDGGGRGKGGGGGGGRTEKGGKGAEKKAGGGGKKTNVGGKGGGGGGGGGKGKGGGGGGGGGKRGGGHGTAAGDKDGDGKEKRDGGKVREGGNGRDGGNGHGKCKCDAMRSKEKCRKSESGCKSGSKTSDTCGNESDVADSHGSGRKCEDEEPHLDRLALRRPSFKPARRSRMPELHPIYRSKLIRCLQETPPCLYNYIGPRKPNGLRPRYP